MPKVIQIEIPDPIVENYSSIDELEHSIFEDIIVSEFQKGNISIRESADLLGLSYEGVITFLGKRGVSFINASKSELDESYKNFERFMLTYQKT